MSDSASRGYVYVRKRAEFGYNLDFFPRVPISKTQMRCEKSIPRKFTAIAV